MNSKGIRIDEILDANLQLGLRLLTTDADLTKVITESDINRPGLAMAGFFDHFASKRVQVFGRGESAFVHHFSPEVLKERQQKFFEHNPVCMIFTHNILPPEMFIEGASQYNIPTFVTPHKTHKLVEIISEFLDYRLAPRTIVHGVFIEVYGVGILLTGKAGVGKSETALKLIERGHRLIADDAVKVLRIGEAHLYGYSSDRIGHHMEIRGLGIINIRELYGSGGIRNSQKIDLIIQLEDWDENKEYDRLGIDNAYETILDIDIDLLTIPIKPGRNIPILIETAAKNHRLKEMGIHAAKNFTERLYLNSKENS